MFNLNFANGPGHYNTGSQQPAKSEKIGRAMWVMWVIMQNLNLLLLNLSIIIIFLPQFYSHNILFYLYRRLSMIKNHQIISFYYLDH